MTMTYLEALDDEQQVDLLGVVDPLEVVLDEAMEGAMQEEETIEEEVLKGAHEVTPVLELEEEEEEALEEMSKKAMEAPMVVGEGTMEVLEECMEKGAMEVV